MEIALIILGILAAGAMGYYVGHNTRAIKDRLKALGEALEHKKDIPVDTHKSYLLEPTDIQDQVEREHEETMRRLNR
jgi:type II secretory pathway pseudopilin PulG